MRSSRSRSPTDAVCRPSWAGVTVTVVTVSWTSAAWIQDRWIVRIGEARFIRAGYCSLAVGVVVVAFGAQPDAVPYWLIHVGGRCSRGSGWASPMRHTRN